MPDAGGPLFIAMCGIPFAGKSTLARELATRCRVALVSVDAIIVDLEISVGADAVDQRGWARAMAEGFDRSRRLLADGESVVYDNANHTRRNRDRCRRIAGKANAAFHCVWLDVPVEVARARLEANRARPSRVDVPDASFWQIVDQFEPPTHEPGVIRWQPGMGFEELVHDLNEASHALRHSERSEESSGAAQR